MNTPGAPAVEGRARRRWPGALGVATLVVLGLVATAAFFPWDWLRGPVNRVVTQATGRHFEITQRLDVELGRTVRVRMDGIEFANPAWAREPYLVRARAAEIDVRLWPLLQGRLELPRVRLQEPTLGLEIDADGRRTWALDSDSPGRGGAPQIGALEVDQGWVSFVMPARGADITAQFSLALAEQPDGQPNPLPLSYDAKGRWNHETFEANGRSGGVLQLAESGGAVFPVQVDARFGRTRVSARGTVGRLAPLDGLEAEFNLSGRSLSDLYRLLGVVLPGTPPFALKGHLDQKGPVWHVQALQGRLGRSDLSGDVSFSRAQSIPRLSGNLQSRAVDFEDLAPLIGGKASGSLAAGAPASGRAGKVLPDTPLALAQLQVMNADVTYDIAELRNVKSLPLQRARAHIVLENGLLRLDPLDLGVAGGTVAGSVRVDSAAQPAVVAAKLDARDLQLNRLLPAEALTRSALGRITGTLDLEGRGNSVARVLGSASGNLALLTGRGEISNILLEYIGLDGGEIVKFLVGGDRNVRLRCAAAAFDVKAGLVNTRALVLDTTDTVVRGEGQVSLAQETLDLRLVPEPKDHSILSLRTPIHVGGTLARPDVFPAKGPLALRAGAVVALGAINPLLALAATFEPGPGQDANCTQVLARANQPKMRPARAGRESAGNLP